VFAAAFVSALAAAPSLGQQYPTRSVRIVVGFAPGGSADVLSRIMGQRLAESLGQTVIIENRPAAGGTVATDIVAKAQPDGHTLLLGSVGTMVFAPATYAKLPYDVMRDLEHVGLWVTFPLALVVPASSPLTNVKALVDEARSKPGTLRYGSQGIGASAHIFAEMMNHMARIKVVHVPYRGGAPALVGVLVGEVDYALMAVATALTQVGSGKIRVLGVTSAKPSAMLPGVPPIASVVPGYDALNWHGIEVPAKTPKAIVARLYEEGAKIVRRPDMQEKLHALSMEVNVMAPGEYRAFIKQEIARWGPIIKASGARVE
jgi:tripartite-type tricarboxylate transporter receptor subunit TctC